MKIHEILEKTKVPDYSKMIQHIHPKGAEKMRLPEPGMSSDEPPMNPNDVEREKRRGDGMPYGATKMQKLKQKVKQKYMKPIISPDDLKGLKSFEGKKQAVGETATSGATSAGAIATNPGNGFANGGPGTLTRMGTTKKKKKKGAVGNKNG